MPSDCDPAASAPLSELVAVVDRLERALGHSDPHMDGSSHVPYAKYLDRPGQEMLRVPSLMMADLRTMADALRVAMNIAGDIDKVADDLADWKADRCPVRKDVYVARLRRIAAGIREAQ